MRHLPYLFLLLASVGFAQTPITDANFNEAITVCLSTNPVDGLCYDSEFGAMPDWDVSQVTDMSYAFNGLSNFNANLSDWDVSNVTNMRFMFRLTSFNHPLENWDVSSVTDMESLFNNNFSFNQDISGWDVSNVTLMGYLFHGAASFNQDIGGWDVSNVIDMRYMFLGPCGLNQDISAWDVSNVTNMEAMFGNNATFNQNISSWNTSNTTNMYDMFTNATNFNQDIGDWDVSSVTNMGNMLTNSGLSVENYDATLEGWSTLNLQNNLTLGAGGLQYCNSEEERQSIIDNFGWIIVDAGLAPDCNPAVLTALCQDITIELDAFGMAEITAEDIDNGSAAASGTTNLTYTINQSVFNCNDIGANEVTLTIIAANGDQTSCTSTVTVLDNLDPTAVCQDITIELDDNGIAYLFPPDIDGGSFDNCALSYLDIDQSSFDCSSPTLNNVTLTAFDESGNEDTCVAEVTVLGMITDLTISVDGETASTTNNTASYQWLDCDDDYAPIAGATNQSYTPPSSGNFALELTEGGCVDTTACVYVVPTSTTDLQSNTLSIYPNPTQDIVTISLDSPSRGILKAYDLQGRLIHSQPVQGQGSLDYTIKGEAGLYLIEFVNERGDVFVGKVVKM